MTNEYLDAIRHLCERMNELERRQNNLIIPGKVVALSEDHKKIKVAHGQCETPFIKWLSPCAGDVMEYRAPSVGEPCLLLNLTGGDDTGACWALCGVESTAFPFPTNNPNEHKRVYKNGTQITHDSEKNELTVIMSKGHALFKVPEKVTFDTQELHCTGLISAVDNITSQKHVIDEKSSMQDMRDDYNSHSHSNNVPPPKNNKMD